MLEELLNFFYYKLTSDAELLNILGTDEEWLYHFMAPEEPALPYINHAISEGGHSMENSMVDGNWELSVYTYEATTRHNVAISSRIKRMFDSQMFNATEISQVVPDANLIFPGILLSLSTGGGFISTGNARVKRYDFSFDIRYYRSHL